MIYEKRILGILQGKRDEIAVDKKIKKFAELVWNVLADARSTCFGSYIAGTNPVKWLRWGFLVFPELDSTEPLFAFDLGVEIEIEIANR